MAASQRDVRTKISSVKNIQKITRAMEMVAAARLRRAEQRIEALRPYADALRRMTRQAAQAAGAEASRLPLLSEHEREDRVGLLLVTGDRGLAGGFNSQTVRAGIRIAGEEEGGEDEHEPSGPRALVDYEPDPEEILKRLVPDYVEISIYRALVESTAGFFGAQMTAMRSASDNAGEIITDLTLQMNRARQAEITQEIMEVVAGAEGLT